MSACTLSRMPWALAKSRSIVSAAFSTCHVCRHACMDGLGFVPHTIEQLKGRRLLTTPLPPRLYSHIGYRLARRILYEARMGYTQPMEPEICRSSGWLCGCAAVRLYIYTYFSYYNIHLF